MARSTQGAIAQVKNIDGGWRALVEGKVLRVAIGEFYESKQPAVDRYDFFRDSPTPAAHPLSCLTSATHGSIELYARERRHFGGPRHTVTLRWTPSAVELEKAGSPRRVSRKLQADALDKLKEIFSRSEGRRGFASTSTYATVTWSCDGVSAEASFSSEGDADDDEQAKARRALALFRLAERLDAAHP